MSINKTFKEEIIEKFNDQATTCGHCHPRGLKKMKEGVNEYQSELDENKVLGFIKETLNLYKEVLWRNGYDDCLKEIKQIIENI